MCDHALRKLPAEQANPANPAPQEATLPHVISHTHSLICGAWEFWVSRSNTPSKTLTYSLTHARTLPHLRSREVLGLEEPRIPLGVFLLLEQDHRVDVPFPYAQLCPMGWEGWGRRIKGI